MKKFFLGEVEYEAKNSCHECKRAFFCKSIEQHLRELNLAEIPVWDQDAREKINYIKSELQILGYSFPTGKILCRLSRMSHQDLQDFIHNIRSVKEDYTI